MNRVKSQGASTITMQVARNVYLSSEKTFTRKIYEVLLTFKLEHLLSKDQILEIYLNQIYLGNRAYGFAAASEAYFGKPLKDITIAQAAMLAGLPKAPGANNPVNNPTPRPRPASCTSSTAWSRPASSPPAGHRSQEGAELHLRDAADPNRLHAEYVAETVRQLMYSAVWRQHLHPRPERLHLAGGGRPGWRPTRPCARASWITSAADLPRPREVHRPAERPEGSRRRGRRRAGRPSRTTAT
jgi:membrane carboxypeptidase/penicillin-binding protein